MIRLLPVLVLSLILLSCGTKESEEPKRPNIIFIMSDDHANKAVSAYSDELLQTPHLDRLANEGMLFSNSFVTNSICGPSRAVMLTGKFSHLNGFMDNSSVFDGSQQTFPKLLQEVGYKTAMVGKWHLKSQPTGFDFWDVLPGQGDYFNPDFINADGRYNVEGYVTDIITDKAIGWLDQRKEDEPFCLLVHHKAPHRNWMPDTTYLDMFAEDLPVPDTFFDSYETREESAGTQEMSVARHMSPNYDLMMESEEEFGWTVGYNQKQLEKMSPEFRERWQSHYDRENEKFAKMNLSGRDLDIYKYQRYIKNYLRCIASVDDNVGRLLDYLDESGLAENTIVVYTSDQGFYLGEHGWYDKRWMYEESLRMPLMVRFPESIQAGSVSDHMVQNIDFAPTFLDIAGVEIPDDMQGRSLKPILEGEEPEEWRKDIYYHYYEYPGVHAVKRHYGIRDSRYKLFHSYYDIDKWELYDLQNDPDELHNVYDDPAYKEIRIGLEKRLSDLQQEYAEADPSLWKSPDPILVENKAMGSDVTLSVEPKRKQVPEYAGILVDGQNYDSAGNISADEAEGSIASVSLTGALRGEARYIKVALRPLQSIDAKYPGAGNPAWMFVDEIVVN